MSTLSQLAAQFGGELLSPETHQGIPFHAPPFWRFATEEDAVAWENAARGQGHRVFRARRIVGPSQEE